MLWRRRRRQDRELAEELELYLAQEIEDNRARGMSADDARAAARKKLGSRALAREAVYEMNSVRWLDTVWGDLKYGLRQLRLSPGFAVTAILTLALGIGANTAMFELLNALRLRSLPVERPGEIMQVVVDGGIKGWGTSDGPYDATNPLWEEIRRNQQAFSKVFAWSRSGFLYGEGVQAKIIPGVLATGGMFSTLGVKPYRGRLLSEGDDRRGCAPGPTVISYGMWQREFGGQDSAIGAKLMLNDKLFEVVGVTPPEYLGLEVGNRFDVVVPHCVQHVWGDGLEQKHVWAVIVMGRLRPGWTEEKAAQHLKAASGQWFAAVPPTGYAASGMATWQRFRLTAAPAGTGVSGLREQYERSLWLLLGITSLVLVIACANLANLMLARAASREREMAVRLAIGASRKRLLAQVLSESLLLAAAGAALGAMLAGTLSRTLLWYLGNGKDEHQLDLSSDWRVLVFTTAVALATCLLFGLAPALRSAKADVAGTIHVGARGATAGRNQFLFHRFLIAGQIAVSLVLVVGALVFVRSFHKLTTVETGIRQEGVAVHFINFVPLKVAQEARLSMQRQLLDRVRSVPGIEHASTTTHVAMGGGSWALAFRAPDLPGKDGGWSRFTWASADYFKTMGIPLKAGRDFTDRDTPTSPHVVIVNEAFVRKYYGNANAIGRQFRTTGEPGYPPTPYEIVGVAGDTKYFDLREEMPPIAYAPQTQNPRVGPWIRIVTRSSIPAEDAIAAVQRVMQAEYPSVRMGQFVLRTMVEERLVRERLLAWVSGFFGALAVVLAMIGLYGVLSYTVARRRNEIGIRLALGSERRGIVRLVMVEVAVLVAVGVAAGGALTYMARQGVGSLLFDVTPTDPEMLVAAIAVLAFIAGAGSLIPAWRAAGVNPVVALRAE